MNIHEITLEDMLSQKDLRHDTLLELETLYPNQSLISFKLNIPGPIKTNDNYRYTFDLGLDLLNDVEILRDWRDFKTGPEVILLSQESKEVVKEKMIEIEDNFELGRLYDLDVVGIDRKALNQKPRLCLLCDEEAHACSRSRKHGLQEVIKEINHKIEVYKQNHE